MFIFAPDAQRLRPLDDEATREAVSRLVQRFADAFPEIAFDITWQSDSFNAQAYRVGERCRVVLYGGLARHRELGLEALALATAHEIGHHKGGPPFHRFYHWMSTDRRDDEWAAEVGMQKIYGTRADQMTKLGATQLLAGIAQVT